MLRLPEWVEELASREVYPTAEGRMRLAVELSRQNVERGTGGTFGAAIFERESGRPIAPGVNLVVGSGCSVFHAEMGAILVAQRVVGDFDLGGEGSLYELVASTEPCVMCLGAVPWYSVRSLLCGAGGEDAEEIGFDERTKPDRWVRSLEKRGIVVTRDVLRGEAASVLREYAKHGGEIYNSRQAE